MLIICCLVVILIWYLIGCWVYGLLCICVSVYYCFGLHYCGLYCLLFVILFDLIWLVCMWVFVLFVDCYLVLLFRWVCGFVVFGFVFVFCLRLVMLLCVLIACDCLWRMCGFGV